MFDVCLMCAGMCVWCVFDVCLICVGMCGRSPVHIAVLLILNILIVPVLGNCF